MIINKFLPYLIILFLIPLALAELQIIPISYDGSVFLGIEKKAEIELKNTFNHTIFNINFTDIEYTDIPLISKLEPNESIKINLTIKTNNTFEKKTFNSVIRFWFLTDIQPESENYNITITNEGFIPEHITIKVDDTITFNNSGSLPAVIKDFSNKYFDNVINVNQSVTISSFSEIDDFTYRDLNDPTKIGRITVNEQEQVLINNPDYNKVFSISFDSLYIDSEIGIEIFPKDNLSMKYNDLQEISLRVWNKGGAKIYNVTLEAGEYNNWFTFEENNFDLTIDQNNYVNIKITPIINNTNNTNMTYYIDLIANPKNAQEARAELSIFIPYEPFIVFYGNLSRAELISQINALREVLQGLDLSEQDRIEYIYINSTIEFDKDKAMKNFRDINQRLTNNEIQEEKQTKSINEQTQNLINILTDLQNINRTLGNNTQMAIEADKRSEELKTSFYLFVFLIVLSIFSIVIAYRYYKKKKIEKRMTTYGN